MQHDDTIREIRALHRDRTYLMETRKILDLRLGALLRRAMGWRKDLPEIERKKIANQAAALMKDPDGSEFEEMIRLSLDAKHPFETKERELLKEMEKLAESLPVWPVFGEPIRGFGPGSLAVIMAEAGDLSGYADHSKLWKRMGLAVMNGVRQGGLAKNASKEDWIAHGYSPRRRSRMWNIGDALIKGNRDGAYRTAYLARKAYEAERDPENMTDPDTGKPNMHAHRRAQRYMEKRLLKDLWRAWRDAQAPLSERANRNVPPSPTWDRWTNSP